MKSLRVMLCALPLALTGCSTMSAVNWSAAYPWNWFGASTEVTEQGVGKLTASTPLNEQAISDALGSDYRLRSGMKTDKGNIVHYFEALKNNSVALTINGDNGAISRIDVRDADIKTASGVKIGTPFSDLYSKAFGNCQKGSHDNGAVVECQAEEPAYQLCLHWPLERSGRADALRRYAEKLEGQQDYLASLN